MSIPLLAAVLTSVIAIITDLRRRRIPNVLTFGSAVAGIAFHAMSGGPLHALGGWAVGLVLFLPVFLLRGMGAGDVKLLAAIGAWVGPWLALWTGLYTAVAGGVLAVAVSLRHRYASRLLANLWVLLMQWRIGGIKPVEGFTLQSGSSPRLPYAIPIFTGLVLALWLR